MRPIEVPIKKNLTRRSEKNELTNEANQIIKTIKQMEGSLEDRKDQDPYRAQDSDLKVTVPLSQCVERLKEKQGRIAQVHRERFEQIKSEHAVDLTLNSTDKS